jgi:hypothetical protein
MDRRVGILYGFVAAGCFQLIENPVHHIQGRFQDKISGHQFYRRSMVAMAKADETLGDNIDPPLLDAPFNGLGDSDAARAAHEG